jgi:hypothetical protein
VIAACVHAGNGGGSETTDAVGLQPLPRGGLRQVTAEESIEFDAVAWAAHATWQVIKPIIIAFTPDYFQTLNLGAA